MAKRLGELLLESGAVTPADLEAALSLQASGAPERLGEILISMGRLDPETLALALSHQSGLPFVRLQPVATEVSDLISLDLQLQYRMAPIGVERDGPRRMLRVALADPSAAPVVEELSAHLGMGVKIFIASSDSIEAAHAAYQGQDPIVWPHPSPIQPTAPVAPVPAAPARPPPVAPVVVPKLNIPAAPARPLPRKPAERPRTSPPPAPLASAPTVTEAASRPVAAPEPPLAGLSLPDWLADPLDGADIKPHDRALQLKLETLFAHGGIPSTESALATVVALLIRRGLLREREVLEALDRK